MEFLRATQRFRAAHNYTSPMVNSPRCTHKGHCFRICIPTLVRSNHSIPTCPPRQWILPRMFCHRCPEGMVPCTPWHVVRIATNHLHTHKRSGRHRSCSCIHWRNRKMRECESLGGSEGQQEHRKQRGIGHVELTNRSCRSGK